MEIIGLIPAGGSAKRLPPLPCSKEIFPVGFSFDRDGSPRPKAACCYQLEGLKAAGVTKSFIVLRSGKWDIPTCLGNGKDFGLHLGYLLVDIPYGAPFTLDAAYPFVKDSIVVMGFPDIICEPSSAYKQLIERHRKTGADVVLGLFEAVNPQKVDMVELDEKNALRRIDVKPSKTNLEFTWLMAVWTPVFTEFLHRHVANSLNARKTDKEAYVGEVLQEAVDTGIAVDTIRIQNGRYIDIGTPDDLHQALKNAFVTDTKEWNG